MFADSAVSRDFGFCRRIVASALIDARVVVVLDGRVGCQSRGMCIHSRRHSNITTLLEDKQMTAVVAIYVYSSSSGSSPALDLQQHDMFDL